MICSVSMLQVISAPTKCFVLAIFLYHALFVSISPVWQDPVAFPTFKHSWSHLQLVVECVLFSMRPFSSISRSMPELVDEARSVSSKSYYIGGVCLTMSISGWTWEGFCNFWSREIRLVSFFMQGPKVLMNLACVVFFPPPCLLGSSAVRKGCWIGLLGLISRQSFGVICTSFISWFNYSSLQIVNILELCCWV